MAVEAAARASSSHGHQQQQQQRKYHERQYQYGQLQPSPSPSPSPSQSQRHMYLPPIKYWDQLHALPSSSINACSTSPFPATSSPPLVPSSGHLVFEPSFFKLATIPSAFIWPEAVSSHHRLLLHQHAHHHQQQQKQQQLQHQPLDAHHAASSSSNLPLSEAAGFEEVRGEEEEKDLEDIVPTIDLSKWRSKEPGSIAQIVKQACEASKGVGFFQVINHGVPQELIQAAHRHSRAFFNLPAVVKQRAERSAGESYGYASSFTSRFASRLPWKETFSLQPSPVSNISTLFHTVYSSQQPPQPNVMHKEEEGEEEEEKEEQQLHGTDSTLYSTTSTATTQESSSDVFQQYSDAMIGLGLEVLDMLSAGLGLQTGSSLRRFFDPEHSSILRLNNYPTCQQPWLTYGTGPHTDPTGLTLLHQDHVAGLQVFHKGHWYTVSPRSDAFVINIGDTLMALTNERYKSCLHRALVNKKQARGSIAFFFNPGFNVLLSPPQELVDETSPNPRAYHDFTWATFLYFTQCVHRSGVNTLHTFNQWLAAAAAAAPTSLQSSNS